MATKHSVKRKKRKRKSNKCRCKRPVWSGRCMGCGRNLDGN